LSPSFGDVFKHLTQCVDELPAKNDIVLALLVEPQNTSPAGTASINGDVVVNPLKLPLIDHSIDDIILPLNNIVSTNGRLSSFEDLPTILFGGTEYVSVDILKEFAAKSSIPNTPPMMLPPIVSATEHSMSMLGSSLRVASGTSASSPSPTPSTKSNHAQHASNLPVIAMFSNDDLNQHSFFRLQNLKHGNMSRVFPSTVFCTAANGSNISQSGTSFVTLSRSESARKLQRRPRKSREKACSGQTLFQSQHHTLS
jgi:hypothetical protein